MPPFPKALALQEFPMPKKSGPGFSLIVFWAPPEEVSLYRVPSDHPSLPALRVAAGRKAVVNTVRVDSADADTICQYLSPEEGDAPLKEFKVSDWALPGPFTEVIMVGFAM
jgi:hypothetical protein